MEKQKILTVPSGNIQDIKYLYTLIAGLKNKGGKVTIDIKMLDYFKKLINDYNDAKATKFGLSFKPREVNIKVIKHVLSELRYLGLIKEDVGDIILTSFGEEVALLIENRESDRLKEIFSKLMLEKFSIFEFFLKRIKELENKGAPIPLVNSEVIDRFDRDVKKVAEGYVNIINRIYLKKFINVLNLYKLLDNENIDTIKKKTEKKSKFQAIIEKFIVSELFEPLIKSRRTYDFVRSRATSLGLTNYALFVLERFPMEITYLTSDFIPSFENNTTKINYQKGCVFLNTPTFEEIKEKFKKIILDIFDNKKNEFGYMEIADLRDAVCKELRISDDLFDTYIKKIYKEEPHLLSFTYGGAKDRITEKRLPIIFEKPAREFFTLVKINQKEG